MTTARKATSVRHFVEKWADRCATIDGETGEAERVYLRIRYGRALQSAQTLAGGPIRLYGDTPGPMDTGPILQTVEDRLKRAAKLGPKVWLEAVEHGSSGYLDSQEWDAAAAGVEIPSPEDDPGPRTASDVVTLRMLGMFERMHSRVLEADDEIRSDYHDLLSKSTTLLLSLQEASFKLQLAQGTEATAAVAAIERMLPQLLPLLQEAATGQVPPADGAAWIVAMDKLGAELMRLHTEGKLTDEDRAAIRERLAGGLAALS